MNIDELDLDLDGVQAMLLDEHRRRAWLENGRAASPPPFTYAPSQGREARWPSPEPAWD